MFDADESGANCGVGRCAVRWDSTSNTTTTIDIPTQYLTPGLAATNYDGSVIVGLDKVWDSFNGVRDIVDVMALQGIDISEWSGIHLEDISSDGSYIVGFGTNPEGQHHTGFMITALPECTTGLF